MAEQPKRGSPLGNGEHVQSSKKQRGQASPTAVVKRELPEEGRRGEELEEEVGPGGGAGAVAATEVMEEPQLDNLRMGLTLFHCRACLLPLKPPTFKCEAGHIVCETCRVSHAQACGGAATYAACADVDAFVRDAKLPCWFKEHGCASYVVYYQARDHERACPWAPCYCPDPGCGAFTSTPRLLEHFRADHPSWPVTDVSYGKPYSIEVPRPPQGLHVLVGQEDRCVFLVSSSALGPATCVSVVCVRANGDAAAGVPQFKCKLWADDTRGNGIMAMLASVESSNLSGGFAAVEQGLFLAVTPKMAQNASGEEPILKVRIDKLGHAAANSTPSPAASSSGKQLVATA